MEYHLPLLESLDVHQKRVLLRLDLDVPLQNGTILDATRLEDSLETVQYLLEQKATVIIIGHMGRPKGVDTTLSLEPVAHWFHRKLGITIELQKTTLDEFSGWKLDTDLILLENIRFFDGEEDNDPLFCQKLAHLADCYVNDAFAVSHRSHGSVAGVAKLLPHGAGLHLQKEVETLQGLLQHPKRPLVVVIGGAKIETKLPLVEKMHKLADYVLVGGKIAQETRTLLQVQHEKVQDRLSVLLVADLNTEQTDVTEKSSENFSQIVQLAKTIVWNGPIGMTQNPQNWSEQGTLKLAQAIVASNAFTILGGGDTIEFVQKLGLLGKFSFVSTGGGAMLSFLSGEKLPGLEALR